MFSKKSSPEEGESMLNTSYNNLGSLSESSSSSSSSAGVLSTVKATVAAYPIPSGFLAAGVLAGVVAAAVVLTRAAAVVNVSSGPEQIMLASGITPNHMYVNWVIPYGSSFSGRPDSSLSPAPPIDNTGSVPVNSRVQWGFTGTNLTYENTAVTTTYSYVGKYGSLYNSTILVNSTIGCLNPYATCDGALAPGVTFYYRVGDDVNGFSEVIQAYTLAAPGTPNVRLAVIGDLGTTDDSMSTISHVVNNMKSERKKLEQGGTGSPITGVLHVGDLSYADGTQPVWDVYGNVVQPVASTVPYLYGVGNHEWFDFSTYNFTAFMLRFRTPGGSTYDATKLYYSFDTGLMHVIQLQGYCPSMRSTSTQPCLAAGSAQLTWLLDDLSRVDRKITPWVIVTFHQPYVNSNTAHPIATEGLPMQLAIEQTLYDAGVDLVLSGHVHAYERSCRVFNYTCTANAPYYITIGDGGNREGLALNWTPVQPSWSVFRQATFGHGEITAINDTHLLWQWHQNPDLEPMIADEFYIVKNETGPVGPGVTGTPKFRDLEEYTRTHSHIRGTVEHV